MIGNLTTLITILVDLEDIFFLDNYLGRSEKTGLLSQQFIMAGGGFKSFFEDPTSNNFMLTSNLNIGLWKWLEGYLDLGILKNKDQESRYFMEPV